MDAVPLEVGDFDYHVGVKAPDNSAVYDQVVRVEWSIPYVGVAEPEPVRSSC